MAPVNRYLPWIALFAVYILWGSTYLGIRVAIETMPPYLMIGVRYLIAGGLLWLLHLIFAKEKPSLPTRREFTTIAITGVLLLVLGNGLLAFAEQRVPTGLAALLVASMPLWMLLLEAVRVRTMLSWASIAGLALGTLGTIALVGEPTGRANVGFALLLLFSSFAWALGTIVSRGAGKQRHPLTVPLEMIVGGGVAVIVGLLSGEATHFSLAAVSTQSWLGMLWLITGGAMVGYTAFTYIVRTLPAATVATYAYVNPVVAVILGAAFLHEPLTWNLLAGGAAVVASVVVILLGNRKPEAQERCDLAPEAA